MALAECCILGGRGAELTKRFLILGAPMVRIGLLFGESQSRFLLSADPTDVEALRAIAERHEVELRELGTTGGDRVAVTGVFDLSLEQVARAHAEALMPPG